MMQKVQGIGLALLLGAAGWLAAQEAPPVLPKEVKLFAATGAVSVAVCDEQGLLAAACRGAVSGVQLWKLDPDGVPSAEAVTLPPAVPAGAGALQVGPLRVLFHPRQPVLYVWQGCVLPPQGAPERQAADAEFRCLVVYRWTNNAMETVGSFVGGTHAFLHVGAAALAVDPEGRRLFMAPLRPVGATRTAIGWLDLDAEGLPKQTPVLKPGSLDNRGLEEFEMAWHPYRMDVPDFGDQPLWSLVAPSATVLWSGTPNGGLFIFDTENRRAAVAYCSVPGIKSSAWTMLAMDPIRPQFFGVGQYWPAIFRMAHAEGYPTLLPETRYEEGAACSSEPVVMTTEPPRVAVGGGRSVHAWTSDKNGRLGGERLVWPVPSAEVRAMAWSVRFKTLYVPAEGLP